MLDPKMVMKKLERTEYGLRCVMGTGGFKSKPKGLDDKELAIHAVNAHFKIVQDRVRLLVAEQLLFEWGRDGEYRDRFATMEVLLSELAQEEQKKAGAIDEHLSIVAKEIK